MHTKSVLLACAFAAIASVPAARAESLVEVYQQASKNDPVVREAEARRLASLEAKPQARGLLFPQISVGGEIGTRDQSLQSTSQECVDTDGDPATACVSLTFDNDRDTDSDYWQWNAQLRQTLFRWDQWQQLKRADSRVALAEAEYRAAQQDLMLRVSQRYFDVLAAEDTLNSAEATLQSFARQLEQAEKRFEVGLIAITDVQESRAAHDSATAAVILAKRALATNGELLRELTGELYVELMKPTDELPLNQPDPQDEQYWVDQSLEQNLAVIAARLGVDVAKTDIRIAQSGHMPTVDLYATSNEFDSDATQRSQGVSSPADANQTQDTVGIQFNLPIYSGGAVSSRVREQVYLHRAAREQLEGATRVAERQTRDAYLGVIAEKARVSALRQSVASNRTALEATEAGFEVGTRTTVDVLDARRRLFEAERDYARTRYDYLNNLVKLKSAAGLLLPADLDAINGYLTEPVNVQPTGVTRR